jgi:hypothetical protein
MVAGIVFNKANAQVLDTATWQIVTDPQGFYKNMVTNKIVWYGQAAYTVKIPIQMAMQIDSVKIYTTNKNVTVTNFPDSTKTYTTNKNVTVTNFPDSTKVYTTNKNVTVTNDSIKIYSTDKSVTITNFPDSTRIYLTDRNVTVTNDSLLIYTTNKNVTVTNDSLLIYLTDKNVTISALSPSKDTAIIIKQPLQFTTCDTLNNSDTVQAADTIKSYSLNGKYEYLTVAIQNRSAYTINLYVYAISSCGDTAILGVRKLSNYTDYQYTTTTAGLQDKYLILDPNIETLYIKLGGTTIQYGNKVIITVKGVTR